MAAGQGASCQAFFILRRGSEHVNEGKEPAEISRRVREALFSLSEYFSTRSDASGMKTCISSKQER